MSAKMFLVDAGKCSGCSLCVVACKDEHVDSTYQPWTKPQPEAGHFWIGVRSLERGRLPRVRVTHLPVLCQHCGNAACMKACGDDAIRRRDDGLVWIDPAACTGCGLCREACPYDVIYFNAELGIAQKCTGCAHRIDEGLLPRCVDVCPHEAIVLGEETDASFGTAGPNGAPEVYRPEFAAEPRVVWRGLPKPRISGAVFDAGSDEVITDASVTATDLLADGSATNHSDAFGEFWVRGLKDGWRYRVTIAKEGYDAATVIVTTDGDQDLGSIALNPTA